MVNWEGQECKVSTLSASSCGTWRNGVSLVYLSVSSGLGSIELVLLLFGGGLRGVVQPRSQAEAPTPGCQAGAGVERIS